MSNKFHQSPKHPISHRDRFKLPISRKFEGARMEKYRVYFRPPVYFQETGNEKLIMMSAAAAAPSHPHTSNQHGCNRSGLHKCDPDCWQTDVNHLSSAIPVLFSSSFLQQGGKKEVCVSGSKYEGRSVVNSECAPSRALGGKWVFLFLFAT